MHSRVRRGPGGGGGQGDVGRAEPGGVGLKEQEDAEAANVAGAERGQRPPRQTDGGECPTGGRIPALVFAEKVAIFSRRAQLPPRTHAHKLPAIVAKRKGLGDRRISVRATGGTTSFTRWCAEWGKPVQLRTRKVWPGNRETRRKPPTCHGMM